MSLLSRFIADADGATAIEYALIGAVVACIMLIGMTLMGNQMAAKYTMIASTVLAASS
jgi:pilus assembly protein Flp/PilA